MMSKDKPRNSMFKPKWEEGLEKADSSLVNEGILVTSLREDVKQSYMY